VCGIAGFIDRKLSESDADRLIEQMLSAIAHRGPDARDTWKDLPVVLGHNRLSILDLSADGTQPMHGFGAVIVFNGEVYNYLELRKELEQLGDRFSTRTDTEVVLAAYRRWGTDCVKRFVGMWAFALWDIATQSLFCSRDRFGIKPFHYIEEGGRFYFGSEYKALRCSPLFSARLNVNQALRGLQLGWNAYHDESYYTCVRTLPPASNLYWKDGNFKLERYWDVSTVQDTGGSFADDAERFRELFMDSIHLHMRSDVEIGSCLSGGIDSSAITAAVGKLFPETAFKTFTVYYEGKDAVDERPWVAEVLKQNSRLKPYYLQPSDEEIAAEFEKAIYHADVPLAGSSPISQYFVMKLAAAHGVKVLLDGQGSDEYLGGYLHSFYRLIGGYFRSLQPGRALSEWNAHATLQQMSGSKKRDVLLKSLLSGYMTEQRLYDLEFRNYYPFMGKDKSSPFSLPAKDGSRLNQFLYQLTFTTSLPTLLQFEDRNSMAFSIESRVPFLDHRLLEFAFSRPDDRKISKGVTKRLLRQALNGILPDAIAARSDKKGFVTPGEVKWLRGPLSHLLSADFKNLDFIQAQAARSVLEDFRKGDNSKANLVWRLVVLDYWSNRYC